MKKLLAVLALFISLSVAASAQIPGGGGISVGAPITGTCTNGFVVYNNAGVVGCEAAGGAGTVTSVDVSGSGAGLTSSGGPITTSGTITLGATTQSAGDNTTKVATTAFVTTAINNAIAGVNPAVSVNAATTAASDTSGLAYNNGVAGIGATFTGTANTALTVDGVTFTALGQRLLVKNDTQSPSGAFNGVYSVTQVQTGILPPILTRALDYDAPSDINSTGAIPVISGTVNATTSWLITSSVNTVGTDALSYTQFSIAPSSVVTLTGVQSITGVKTLTSPINAGLTWATVQGLSATAGQQVYTTNYGTKGALLQYDGARWKPVSGCAFIATLDTTSGNATNAAELTVLSYQFAAGMVQLKDRLRIGINQIKSGTTDTAMWKNYFGPLGTASDPLLFSANSLGAANLRDSIFVDFRVETATTVQQLGSGGGYSTASSAAIPPPVTVSSVTSNAMTWLTNIISNGGTNTTAAQDVFLQLCAPAN